MKNFYETSIVILMAICSFGNVYADQTSAVTYSATLYSVMKPVIITQPNFGIISVDTSMSNTATIILDNTSNQVTSTSPGITIDSGGASGVLKIVGESGKSVGLSISSSIAMSSKGGATGLKVAPSLASTTTTLTGGSATVGFGGSLSLPALNTSNLTGFTYSGSGVIMIKYL